jgi:phosphatidylinositol glycan class B
MLVRGKDVTYGQRNLWIIVLSYLFIMSFNSHKEFRYILPVLPLLCLLTARHVRYVVFCKTQSQPRRNIIGTVFVVVNLIVLLYLGLFHQSGPIKVNHAIVDAVSRLPRTSLEPVFSIHYLTGACHSTPLLSHLHKPPVRFDTWHLDCSPDCRSDPDQTCEYERFAVRPVEFVSETYFVCDQRGEKTCLLVDADDRRVIPDFVVTLSSYADAIRPLVLTAGLHEVARFPHHINGASIPGSLFGDFIDERYRHFTAVPGLLDVSLEEVVLFSKHSTGSSQRHST